MLRLGRCSVRPLGAAAAGQRRWGTRMLQGTPEGHGRLAYGYQKRVAKEGGSRYRTAGQSYRGDPSRGDASRRPWRPHDARTERDASAEVAAEGDETADTGHVSNPRRRLDDFLSGAPVGAARQQHTAETVEAAVAVMENLATATRVTRNGNPAVAMPRAERQETHDRQFMCASMGLTRRHFATATTAQLIRMLRAAVVLKGATAGHVALEAAEQLLRRIDDGSGGAAPTTSREDTTTGGGGGNERHAAPTARELLECLHTVHRLPSTAVVERCDTVMAACVRALGRDAVLAGFGVKELTLFADTLMGNSHRVPAGVGREALRALGRVLLRDSERPISTWLYSGTLSAMHRFQLLDEDAVALFKKAVPPLIADVNSMSGGQIARVLGAYAAVGFYHPELFLTLGQRAGDMGVDLRPRDAALILAAFERTPIDASKLRAALQSAMRMHGLRRAGL